MKIKYVKSLNSYLLPEQVATHSSELNWRFVYTDTQTWKDDEIECAHGTKGRHKNLKLASFGSLSQW